MFVPKIWRCKIFDKSHVCNRDTFCWSRGGITIKKRCLRCCYKNTACVFLTEGSSSISGMEMVYPHNRYDVYRHQYQYQLWFVSYKISKVLHIFSYIELLLLWSIFCFRAFLCVCSIIFLSKSIVLAMVIPKFMANHGKLQVCVNKE